jgi:alpha-D-ribose 1-methylphosphonate 5-triphosphate synthase subunit PhnH
LFLAYMFRLAVQKNFHSRLDAYAENGSSREIPQNDRVWTTLAMNTIV